MQILTAQGKLFGSAQKSHFGLEFEVRKALDFCKHEVKPSHSKFRNHTDLLR